MVMASACGFLRPPLGGTLATVPSKILRRACCTPSPETSRVMEVLQANFRPEFLNRVDETIIFHGLQKTQLREIVKIQVQRLESRLAEQKLSLKLSETALDFLAEIGYDPVYGARPLKRAIQRYLETAIAKSILRGEYKQGETIFVDVEAERLSFKHLSNELLTA